MKLTEWLTELLNTDSPTGFTHKAADFVADSLRNLGLDVQRTRKGAVTCSFSHTPSLCFAAHLDTLGFIVSGVAPNGTLHISPLGSPLLPTFEGAYVRVYTMAGACYSGTLLLNNPSAHANRKAATIERTIADMHVRLDEDVQSQDDVLSLGISNGDVIAVDPRVHIEQNGYIKSHFLDNKAGCAVLYGLAQRLSENPSNVPVQLFFSTYEEVGHGGATGFADSVEEIVVVDMGVIGDSCSGSERKVSICAKDSGGPYDYNMRSQLVKLAQQHSIPHAVDIYPFYSSDGTAAWRAGIDARIALIGPGVAGSHGIERTHESGILATVDLCEAYIKQTVQSFV